MLFAPPACGLLKQAFAPAAAVGVPFRLALLLPAPSSSSKLQQIKYTTSTALVDMRQLHTGDAWSFGPLKGSHGVGAGASYRASPRPSPVAPAACRCCRTQAAPTSATASCAQPVVLRLCRGQLQTAVPTLRGTPFHNSQQQCLGASSAMRHIWSSLSALQPHSRSSSKLRGRQVSAASAASAAAATGTGPDGDQAGPGSGGGASGEAAVPRHTSGLGQVIASASNFVRVEIHTELPEDAPTPPGWRPAHLRSHHHTTDPHPHQDPPHQPPQPPNATQIASTTADQSNSEVSTQRMDKEGEAPSSSHPPATAAAAAAAPEPRRPVILCSVRALLRKLRQEVLVGDVVRVSSIDWGQGRGVVGEVLPRSSRTTDPDVANVDHMLLVMALDRPPFEPQQVSRFLVAAEASGLPFTLCLNKADLVPPYVLQRRLEQCRSWGYEPVVLSCETGEGVEQVARALEGRISVVAGPSGAGKSSLINSLRLGRHRPDLKAQQQQQGGSEEEDGNSDNTPLPALPLQEALAAVSSSGEGDSEGDSEGEGEAAAGDGGGGGSATEEGETGEGSRAWRRRAGGRGRKGEAASGAGPEAEGGVEFLAVGELSRIGRGMHTTTSIRLLRLLGGGWLADTPGFGQPTLEGISSQQLAGCFPEVAALTSASPCRYRDCLHVAEPGCAVNGAGLERYGHYLRFLQEIRTREGTDLRSLQRAKMEREGYARVKSSKGGTERLEVKLDGRKHRRQSRQSARQASEQQD